jgi:class 3 adenylate cyclase/tetratricopeptide (TPR) repeat protein
VQCPRCKADNREGLSFCEDCGTRLAVACPACGAEITPGKRFCGSCGASLAAGRTVERFSSPESYTPKHLAERILTSKAALEGERKQVTVLFADLKGSMELLADRDPEEARKILDPVLEHMMEAVHRYEGTVNQVMGDGIMALFGAPLAHEDHAVRACYAALRMQEAVKRYADSIRREEGITIRIRVGLNSGEVVVRAIGSDLHMDYTAVGQTTHLAARMEQLASPGSILVTPSTFAHVEGFVGVKALGPVPVKGLSDTVDVYEVIGTGPARTRLQVAASRGLTRFVGRDAELDQLHRALDRARAGHGQVVGLVGEPGVGKSRLVREFHESIVSRSITYLEGRCVPYGSANPCLPLQDIVRDCCGIAESDLPETIAKRVGDALHELGIGSEDGAAYLLHLLAVREGTEGLAGMSPDAIKAGTFATLTEMLLRASQQRPVVVAVEDLHWIDKASEEYLIAVTESLAGAPILQLGTYRPGYGPPWTEKSYATQIAIQPLSPEESRCLFESVVARVVLPESVGEAILGKAEGNPFFLEELTRAVTERERLEPFALPDTVQGVLMARIDRLQDEPKRVLQTAAVLGREFSFKLLLAVWDGDPDLERHLRELKRLEFIYERWGTDEGQYVFKHALTQEVAYDSVLRERRRRIHARIVEAIELLYSNRVDEYVHRLAHHALMSESWDKAVSYSRQAGSKAAARSANREAIACFEHALVALAHVPESRSTLEQGIDLRFKIRHSLVALGDMGRILEYLREAETRASALDDQRRLGRAYTYMTNYFFVSGDQDRAIESGRRARDIAAATGDIALELETVFHLSGVHIALGDYRQAIELLRPNLEFLGSEAIPDRSGMARILYVNSCAWATLSFAELGEFASGIAQGEEGVRVAEALGHPYSLGIAQFGVGLLHIRHGDLSEAISLLERGLALSRRWNIPFLFRLVGWALGYAYAISGRVAEAVPLLDEASRHAASLGMMSYYSLQIASLSEARLLGGYVKESTDIARRALELACQFKERGNQAWAHRLLGEIGSLQNPPHVDSEPEYEHALALATELGMRPLVAHCHSGLAKLYRRVGKPIESDRHFTASTTMYREMGMTYWLEKIQKEFTWSAIPGDTGFIGLPPST